jgi:hypothetical protein
MLTSVKSRPGIWNRKIHPTAFDVSCYPRSKVVQKFQCKQRDPTSCRTARVVCSMYTGMALSEHKETKSLSSKLVCDSSQGKSVLQCLYILLYASWDLATRIFIYVSFSPCAPAAVSCVVCFDLVTLPALNKGVNYANRD